MAGVILAHSFRSFPSRRAMSDPNINIKITTAADTSGADAAAAAIGKVTEAEKEANTRGFGGMLDGTVPRLDDVEDAFEKVTEKAEDLAETLPELTTADIASEAMERLGNTVTDTGASAASTGGKMGGLGRALIGLAGGPVGIAITAITAVLGLVQRWKKSIDDYHAAQAAATQAHGEFIESQREATRELEAQNRTLIESVSRMDDYDAAMNAITQTGENMNFVIRRNIDLLKQQQSAQDEIAKAAGDLELEAAGKDPVKQEEIRNRLRREQQARDLAALEAEKKLRQDLLNRLSEDQKRKSIEGFGFADNAEARSAEARSEAQQKSQLSEGMKRTADELKKEADELGDNSKGAKVRREADAIQENANRLAEEARELTGEADDLEQQAKDARNTVKAEVDGIVQEMNRLFQEIQKLTSESQTKSTVFGLRDQQGDARESRIREETKATEDAKKARKEKDEARAQEREEAKRRREQGAVGREAVSLIPKGATENARAAVEAAAARLQDGDQGGEIARLLELVSQMAGYVQRTQGDQSAHATKIAQLEARINNLK
jgi:predicted  nucleic acid-binding Zn-ribbon protein